MAARKKNLAFDNAQYLKTQSEHIRERIKQFGGRLYLEFGGKLYDDYHASRVLPGFQPDSKLRMLLQMKKEGKICFCFWCNPIFFESWIIILIFSIPFL